jgi:uncharacterized membrane protein YhaH (DUF805 family)
MNWILLPYKRYFDFTGRSRRMEYWSFQLMWVIVLFLIVGISEALGFGSGVDDSKDVHPVALSLLGLWVLGNFIPSLALGVRRWHDLGQTGWFVLLFGVLSAIPLIGLIPALGNIIWFFMPGNVGENKWGPDPKDMQGDWRNPDSPQ